MAEDKKPGAGKEEDQKFNFLKSTPSRSRDPLHRDVAAEPEVKDDVVVDEPDEEFQEPAEDDLAGFENRTSSALSDGEHDAVLRHRFRARTPLGVTNFPSLIKKALDGYIKTKKRKDKHYGLMDVLIEALRDFGIKHDVEGLRDIPDWKVLRKTGR